jgi:hypothetical protein
VLGMVFEGMVTVNMSIMLTLMADAGTCEMLRGLVVRCLGCD